MNIEEASIDRAASHSRHRISQGMLCIKSANAFKRDAPSSGGLQEQERTPRRLCPDPRLRFLRIFDFLLLKTTVAC